MSKFCTDCKHVRKADHPDMWRCVHPDNKGPRDPVTGNEQPIYRHCIALRAGPKGCGEAGKWFERREGVDTYA